MSQIFNFNANLTRYESYILQKGEVVKCNGNMQNPLGTNDSTTGVFKAHCHATYNITWKMTVGHNSVVVTALKKDGNTFAELSGISRDEEVSTHAKTIKTRLALSDEIKVIVPLLLPATQTVDDSIEWEFRI